MVQPVEIDRDEVGPDFLLAGLLPVAMGESRFEEARGSGGDAGVDDVLFGFSADAGKQDDGVGVAESVQFSAVFALSVMSSRLPTSGSLEGPLRWF